MKLLDKLLKRENSERRKPYGHEPLPVIRDFQDNSEQIILEWHNYVATTSSTGMQIDEMSYEQKQLNKDKKWKAFFLFIFGEFNPDASRYFPVTTALAEKWKKDITLVFFSNLEPGSHITPHTGNNHSVIRAQIGIDIKQPDATGLRVEDKTVHLKNKELFIFDDTFEHEAWNNGQEIRTVLIIDCCKKFPHFYNVVNRYLLKKMKSTAYVQSALAKLKERN